MASKKSSKKRAQGGGRTANSEPKVQVFKEFGGCNFQQSPRTFTLGASDEEQSDLQMNFVVVQNNAVLSDNKTIEARDEISKLLDAPLDDRFTNASVLVGGDLYMAMASGSVLDFSIKDGSFEEVPLYDRAGKGHKFQSLEHIDGKIVGTTEQNTLWLYRLDDDPLLITSGTMYSTPEIPNPPAPEFGNLKAIGDLKIAEKQTDECGFRVGLAWSYIGELGPTEASKYLQFYASKPTDEWHSGCYLKIEGELAADVPGDLVVAVEFYFNEGNKFILNPLGRYDFPVPKTSEKFTFNWIGYVDITASWPMMQLAAPKENLTEGVHASRVKCVDGRLYFWGDDENPYRLWIGGNPGNLFNTSTATGGGYVDVEPGTGQEVRYVDKYKTQSGNSIVTILCDSPNSSKEQRYNLVETTVTVSNEQNMKSWQAEQVAGAVGCKSHRGGLVCEDGLYTVSRYGLALTTMTMEYNSQIRANYVSGPIKPVFTDAKGELLSNSVLLEADGVLYCAFGKGRDEFDNMLFCYDIDLKAWWTHTLDVDEPIIDLIHIDWEGAKEGIGIVTEKAVYLLPTTMGGSGKDTAPKHSVLIQTGELSTQQPQQTWFYLSQLEFRFDYIVGDLEIELTGIDQFGRKVTTRKVASHHDRDVNVAEHMRVDLRLQSYRIRISGKARFRMTHFMAKLYTMSSKQGLVWGFDDSQSFRSGGDIHPTFRDYNDIRRAIIP